MSSNKVIHWYEELAAELESVVKGGEREDIEKELQKIIDELKTGESGVQSVSNRLRALGLAWFAQKIDNGEYHMREFVPTAEASETKEDPTDV